MTHPDDDIKADIAAPQLGTANGRQSLRDRADARIKKQQAATPQNFEAMSPETAQRMLHELHAHQIELEMQNEELREAQLVLDLARARYFDLYDLAPLGYITFNPQGFIEQANLAAASVLGLHRTELLKKPLSKFIFKEDQDIFYLKRK